MTIGIAALAERPRHAASKGTGAKAIVLVADKQETWDDDVKELSEIEKKHALAGSWEMLYAGDADAADEIADLLRKPAAARVRRASAMRTLAKDAYRAVRDAAFEDVVLRPRQLTLRDVGAERLRRIPQALLVDYLRAKVEWEHDFGTELIFAGFDEFGRGTLFSLTDPGVLSRSATGTFKTIGAGGSIARTRLIRLGIRPSDPAHVALYKVLDAKFHAELASSVGAGTDAWIMVPSRKARYAPHKVRLSVIKMLRDVFNAETGSAFDEHDPPPADWKRRLEAYVSDVLAERRPRWPSSRRG